MKNTLFSKHFFSTTKELAETLTETLDTLVEHGWCSLNDSFCVRLCIEEALVNAVVHGNKNCAAQKVHVEISDMGDRCQISVSDEGEGFDPHALSMPDCDQLGGRGVCLIKHYMESVDFNCEKKRLEMEFSRETFSCEV